MKRLAGVVLICALFPLTACDDKDARQYAQELINLLDSYQEQADRKVSAEKDSYKELAGVYERARQRNIENTLEQERIERSEKLATTIVKSDHSLRTSEILEGLRSYGEHDFVTARDFLQVEADAQMQFLGDIEALEFESETIDDLRASLKELTKEKGRLKRIRDAAVFAQDTKKEFDKLICQDLDVELKAVDASLKALDDQLAELRKDAQKNAEKIEAKEDEKRTLNKRKTTVQNDKKNKCS